MAVCTGMVGAVRDYRRLLRLCFLLLLPRHYPACSRNPLCAQPRFQFCIHSNIVSAQKLYARRDRCLTRAGDARVGASAGISLCTVGGNHQPPLPGVGMLCHGAPDNYHRYEFEAGALEVHLVYVAPAELLAGRDRLHDGVVCGLEVLGGVLVF